MPLLKVVRHICKHSWAPLHKTIGIFTINGISANYGNYHSNTAQDLANQSQEINDSYHRLQRYH